MLHLVELQQNIYQYSRFNPGNWMSFDIISNAIKVNAYYDIENMVPQLNNILGC